VRQALRCEPLTVYGDGSQSRCFAHVADVTRGLAQLLEHPAAVGEVFNVGATEEITILDLARRVIDIVDSPSEIVCIPYDQAYAPGFEDMQRRVPCIDKISALIGYVPRHTLNDTLRAVIAHERS